MRRVEKHHEEMCGHETKINMAFFRGFIKALDMGAITRKCCSFDEAYKKDYEALKNDLDVTGKEISNLRKDKI